MVIDFLNEFIFSIKDCLIFTQVKEHLVQERIRVFILALFLTFKKHLIVLAVLVTQTLL